MSGRNLTIEDLLSRVNLPLGLNKTCEYVVEEYNLGALLNVNPLFVGHEELNTKITTSKGDYVIKFLNKRKSKHLAQTVVDVMENLYVGGIPVSKILPYGTNQRVFELEKEYGKGSLFLMEYFEGVTFNESPPTLTDKLKMTEIVARMHQLHFSTDPEYDSWLPQYLKKEFTLKSNVLSKEDIVQVERIVQLFTVIDYSKCNKGIGHFDLHRDNAKKDTSGNFCIFDMATVGLDYLLFDLGTFIGLFCFEPTQSLEQNMNIYIAVVNEYLRHYTLNQYEQTHLFDFVKIIYASNVLASTSLMAEGDDTQETKKWYDLGKWGMRTFIDVTM